MFKSFEGSMRRIDLITIAGGLALGVGTYTFAATIVGSLIAPLISVFVGEPHFQLNSFTIGDTEFDYGILIETAMTLALTVGALLLALFLHRRYAGSAGAERACPECTSPIPAAAKRCPHCTAVVQPVGS
jgi:large conductance mechanosensitive channel